MTPPDHTDLLLIGGRSGVGKSTVAFEVSVLLQAASVAHCLIEGDFLSQVFPAPEGDPDRTALVEENLAALWRNVAARGYHRLIYTNTASVLGTDLFTRALGGGTRITGVLLTADDATAERRLTGREIGSQLDPHVRRSAEMARLLDQGAAPWVVRVPTDGRAVVDIAKDVVAATGWA
ncbi:MAG: hypothetical protein WCA46_28100 [Actinocatenispora sp.]